MRPSANLFKLCDDIRYRIIDKEAVIVRLKAGRVLALNEIGARILELIDDRRQLGEIIAALEKEYEVGVEQLETDVHRLVEELLGAGIIEEVDRS
jgi:coenzyme PQQ biosynthesis protein PqqD